MIFANGGDYEPISRLASRHALGSGRQYVAKYLQSARKQRRDQVFADRAIWRNPPLLLLTDPDTMS